MQLRPTARPAPTGIKIDGGAASDPHGGVTVNVTYHDDNSIDFAATGGLVSVAFVKGGDSNANKNSRFAGSRLRHEPCLAAQ